MEIKNPKVMKKEESRKFGCGCDIGTAFINSAVMDCNDEVKIHSQRDAFFDLENEKFSRNMLTMQKCNYIESEDSKLLYIIGQEALNFANVFKKEVRRPLHKGVISTREPEALMMIKTIIKNVLGKPAKENEICKFSVPAAPVDADYNVTYHENVLRSFIESCGYSAMPINEAKAICFEELGDENFTGLSISFGAGMCNACLSYFGNSALEFSVSRSGDWVDEQSAMAIGERTAKMVSLKEKGIDLLKPNGRHEESIAIFYKNLIAYVVKCFEKKLSETTNVPEFPEPISVILSGGTSLAGSFDKVFTQEIEKIKLPFKIKSIRLAEDQMFSVAKGCLFSAMSEYEDD